MNRKQIIEKQKALGCISQSKTGDAILRKNVFELRVLKTKLTELEGEEKRWKTHHSYDVKEAKKEARHRQTAKIATFRRVAHVALAAQRLKNIAPLLTHTDVKEEIEDLEEQPKDNLQEANKSLPRKIQNTTCLPPLSPRTCYISRHYSSSYPDRNYPSPLLVRRKIDTWTGRHRITAESSNISRDIASLPSPRTCTMSPMLDKRFLELKAALVPMHPDEESEDECEGNDEDDNSSNDGISDSILL